MNTPTQKRTRIRSATLAMGMLTTGIIFGCASSDQEAYKTVIPRLSDSQTVVLEPVRTPYWKNNSQFSKYDETAVQRIGARWHELLEEQSRSLKEAIKGKVVLEFKLGSRGNVFDMNVVDYDVDQLRLLICQMAVLDCSPFPAWPDEATEQFQASYRPIRFTFYFNK